MDNAITLQVLITVMFFVLYPKAESQWTSPQPLNPLPLCASQFALVNRACATLPYTPIPPPSPIPDPPSLPSPEGPVSNGHHHRQGHGHDHGHRHGHRHSRHGHKETSAQAECCRWLKEVDNVCVCELLAHLPPFLTRLVHYFTVLVDDTCDVTFQCPSRFVKA